MNLVVFKDQKKQKPQYSPECPILQEEGYEDCKCDLPEFKKYLKELTKNF